MTTQPDKHTETQLKIQTAIPPTKAAEFRKLLKTLDNRISRLADLSPENALEILALFDRVDDGMAELQGRGMNLASELGQLETLSAQFERKSALFIRRIGGPVVLQQARAGRNPGKSHWWWYVDESLARESKQQALRWLKILGLAGAVLLVAVLLYRKFLAPDPAVQASYGYRQSAENAILGGNFEAALDDVENAIANTPDYPELYVLRGVIQGKLDQPEAASQSFEIARQKYETDDLFYNQRTVIYLMLADAQAALADVQTALEINPDSAYSYLYMAQAYELQGEIVKAIESYEQADALAEKSGDAQLQAIIRVSLSTAYQSLGFPTPELLGTPTPTP
jgi:tetratricopeptide (TPR) repeat protein